MLSNSVSECLIVISHRAQQPVSSFCWWYNNALAFLKKHFTATELLLWLADWWTSSLVSTYESAKLEYSRFFVVVFLLIDYEMASNLSDISPYTCAPIFVVKQESDSWFAPLVMLQTKFSQISHDKLRSMGSHNLCSIMTLLICWPRLFPLTWPPSICNILEDSVLLRF